MEWVLLGIGAIWTMSMATVIVLLERAPEMEDLAMEEEQWTPGQGWNYDEASEPVAVAG